MINHLPFYISFIFVLATVFTLFMLHKSIRKSNLETIRNKSNTILFGLIIWLIIQAILTLSNVYKSEPNSFPPKIILFGVLPAIITIVALFVSKNGRQFIDSLVLTEITFLHIVRIPVEVVLFWLFVYKAIPQLMTFEGRNFDILAGISAPFIVYFGLYKQKLNKQIILFWNFICLALLINIVAIAILSTPSTIQKFGLEQPNVAILYFPFSWLPTFIVPIVLFSHLVAIRQLIKNKH